MKYPYNNAAFRLMATRIGLIGDEDLKSLQIPGLDSPQDYLLNSHGGFSQQDRMIYDKRESFRSALRHSYQGARIKKIGEEKDVPALINSNKLKLDYDDKMLSVDFCFGYKVGDIFEWVNTNTRWIIYLQDLTELAYFRGEIRRCSYEIQWKDGDEVKKTYAAVRGPTETKIDYVQKHGISIDNPNLSLNFYVPQNEDTLKAFKRYEKFYLGNSADGLMCWRIEAVDTISSPGIIEVAAVEYYKNETNDDVDSGIVDGLVVEPVNPNPEEIEKIIVGDTFIKPKVTYTYHFTKPNPKWDWDKSLPLDITVREADIDLKWKGAFRGEFELKCGQYNKKIIVESLF